MIQPICEALWDAVKYCEDAARCCEPVMIL
jgi:hypothetical protein